jgi:hypothetical protein
MGLQPNLPDFGRVWKQAWSKVGTGMFRDPTLRSGDGFALLTELSPAQLPKYCIARRCPPIVAEFLQE